MAIQPTHVYREQVVINQDDAAVTQRSTLVERILYYVLNVIETLLALRFLFKMLGANSGSGFTNFLYRLTNPLVVPFRGILPSTSANGSLLEWSTIIAMLIYALIVYAVVKLIELSAQ